MAGKIFDTFLEKIAEFPFWVKEIIYIKLRDEFQNAYLAEAELNSPMEEIFQAYNPIITYKGKEELSERNFQEDEAVYRFLKFITEQSSIAEITLRNFWTLEKTAKIMVYCIQKEYIKKPSSLKIEALALYISGKIKTGEYFKRMGIISIDQLDTAIRKQKELEASGKQVRFAEIMISLGYVTEQETKAAIFLKEECKSRFIFNTNILGKSSNAISVNTATEKTAKSEPNSSQLVLLRQEVYELQQKIRDIANIIKR